MTSRRSRTGLRPVTCDVCAYADVHGYWESREWTHCSGCHLSWKITATTPHCAKCHRQFGGVGGFDAHQTLDESGRVACHDPAKLSRPLVLDERGIWRRPIRSGTWGR